MRVIGGYLGGRPLLAPKGWKVRPTPARVREAIFSALGPVEGAVVADLYAGTGALAIEALSRGAERALLVDREIRPAEGNVRHLDLVDRCEIVRADVAEWLRSRPDGERFDLIFLDPPYGTWPDLGPEIAPSLAGVITPRGRVVVESGAGSPPRLPGFEAVRERRYGRTVVTFHALPEDDPAASDR